MNAATVKHTINNERFTHKGFIKKAITTPLGILASTIAVFVVGLFALIALTETLFFPSLFVALMLAPMLSAIEHFSWQKKGQHFAA